MHPLMTDTLVAERVRDIQHRAEVARQARLARLTRRDRPAAAAGKSAHASPLRILAALSHTGSGHPRAAR